MQHCTSLAQYEPQAHWFFTLFLMSKWKLCFQPTPNGSMVQAYTNSKQFKSGVENFPDTHTDQS